MDTEKKLILFIILIPVVIAISGILGGVVVVTATKNMISTQSNKFITQAEISLQKQKLKTIVEIALNEIKELKNPSQKQIQKAIERLGLCHKDNYVFVYKILNINGGDKFAIMYVNPNKKELQGKFLSSNKKDIKGFAFRDKMLELIRTKKEGFVEYYCKKPNSSIIAKKLTYFKYYKPLKIIVASGAYLDNLALLQVKYKTQLEQIDSKIIRYFIFVSVIFVILILIFVSIVVDKIEKEFYKFRKTIARGEKKLRYKLYIDELTNLKSRKALVEDVEKKKFDCLILVDIDNFKNINQFFGSQIGDLYLQKFAGLLRKFKKHIKKSTILYRVGSDEFALGVLNSNFEQTKKLILELHKFITSNQLIIEDEKFDIDATVVAGDFPNPLKKTLLALSEAQEQKVSTLMYDEIKNKEKEEKFFKLRKLLKIAIEKSQITPFAQPIVDKNQKIIKYELLMRITTDDGEIIPPYFLEYAKKAKLYPKISSIMIDKCFEFAKKTDILCSINIDMQDITNQKTVEKLRNYTNNLNKPIVFEILESESFLDYKILDDFVDEFKQYGVLFAIDDFGSGFSNYKEIINLKPHYLKIDGSLVKDINNSRNSIIIIQNILILTKMLGIKTVAEFVENKEIFQKLKAIGIDEFQGYYFSKPIPISSL